MYLFIKNVQIRFNHLGSNHRSDVLKGSLPQNLTILGTRR